MLWGLIPRGMGLGYLLCFLPLFPQLLPWIGARGVMPAADLQAALRRDTPWLGRLRHNPSLLWLADSDRALQGWLALGILGASLGVVGGLAGRVGLGLAFLVHLSFKRAARMYYPWDNLLAELGFLAIFLPTVPLLPALSADALPSPLLIFAFHWLLFRVVFGFGKTKFYGVTRQDWLYLRYFLLNIPIVTRVGWWASRLPDPFILLGLVSVGVVELLAPPFLLFPGAGRLLAAAAIVAQMGVIQATGNFGYFNVLCLVLCAACLDTGSSLLDAAQGGLLFEPEHLPFTLAFAVIFPVSVAALAFNNWFNCAWTEWPGFQRLRLGPIRAWVALCRWVEPLQVVHSYGVFRASPAPPVRWVTTVEGRMSPTEPWRPFRWRWTQTDARSTPRFVAPHHPRLDHLSFYDGVGVDGTGWFHVVSFADPYRFSRASLLDLTMHRLQEPASPVRRLFADDPFGGQPPAEVRAGLYRFSPTTPARLRETGQYWDVAPIGDHLPPSTGDSTLFAEANPPPELWHWEAVRWRGRARVVAGLSAEAAARFWEVLLPFVREQAALAGGGGEPYTWETLPTVALALRQRFSREELRAFELSHGRLLVAQLSRLDAVFRQPARHFLRDVVGVGVASAPAPSPDPTTEAEACLQALAAWPFGGLRSSFRQGMAVSWCMLREGEAGWAALSGHRFEAGAPIPTFAPTPRLGAGGMAGVAAALGVDVPRLAALGASLRVPAGMFLQGVLDYDTLARTSARIAVLYSSDDSYSPVPTGLVPGSFDLAWELRANPLPPILGYGAAARRAPALVPPRMRFGEDGRWREADSGRLVP